NIADLELLDEAEPPVEWLMDQCQQAEDAAMSVEGITNSEGADTHYSRSNSCLAIADKSGMRSAHCYPSSYFSVSVSVLAGTGTGMERDYDFSSARHRDSLTDARQIGYSAASRALKRL